MLGTTFVLLLTAAPLGLATINLSSRQTDQKAVFAHFIVGIVQNFALDDWIAEMTTAKATGIDGFALNCAPPRVNSYTPTQMSLAYQAAQQIPGGFSVFPSFDFSYWSNGDTSTIVQLLQNYSGESSQALYDGRPIKGESFDWDNVRSAGIDVFAIPMLEDPNQLQDPNTFDGAFSWYAWPTNGSNSIIPGPITTYWDNLFETNLAKADLDQIYMMPVSPWFFTHYDTKNWVFIAEQLITDRWPQVLALQPQLVELVTWNDYGESHYIADFEPDHTDDGSAEWAAGYPHAGWRSITKAFIAAYKAGTTEPVVDQEEVVYWYRSFLKNTPCTGDTLGVPSGVSLLSDSVFVTTLLTSPAVLTVTSGSQAPVSFNVPAGVTSHNVSMGIGAQTFSISRNGVEIASGTGGLQIADTCTIFNYNAYVGNFTVGSGSSTTTTTTTKTTSSTTTTTTTSKTSSTTTSSSTTSSSSSSITSHSSSSSTSSSASTTTTATCGPGCTITASAQIFPTNCMQPGCVWEGPAGQSTPDTCDTGGKPTCTGS